jgi:hypothetical protein
MYKQQVDMCVCVRDEKVVLTPALSEKKGSSADFNAKTERTTLGAGGGRNPNEWLPRERFRKLISREGRCFLAKVGQPMDWHSDTRLPRLSRCFTLPTCPCQLLCG